MEFNVLDIVVFGVCVFNNNSDWDKIVRKNS